ncbi:MAG: CsgG/HfaB family protein [Pseudomonadota bacterium]
MKALIDSADGRPVRLAVATFTGRGGQEVRSLIESRATEATNATGRSVFTVVEDFNRADLERRLGRQASSGLLDRSTVVELGRLTAAEIVLYGDMLAYGVSAERTRETRRVCRNQDSKGKCQAYGDVSISCLIRSASVSFTGRVVSLSDGRILASSPAAGSEKIKQCDGEAPRRIGEGESFWSALFQSATANPPSDAELLNASAGEAVSLFIREVAPYQENMIVAWRTSGSNLSSEGRARMAGAIEFVQQGQTAEGCGRMFDLARTERDFDLIYNVGVCNEIQGNLEQALTIFYGLQQQLVSPDNNVSKRIEELQRRIADQ